MKKMIIVDNCIIKDQLDIPTGLEYELDFIAPSEVLIQAIESGDENKVLDVAIDEITGVGIDIEDSYIVLMNNNPLELYIIKNCIECTISKIKFNELIKLLTDAFKSCVDIIKDRIEEGGN